METIANKPASKVHESEKRFLALKNYATNWEKGWKDMKTYIDPTRGIFNGDRSSIGDPIDNETLLDSYATHAKETAASGLQTGTSDPSKPWFKLTVDDFLTANFPNVKIWLDEVQRRISYILQKSNMYDVMYSTYEELVQFGTGCFLILEDYDDAIRGRSFTCGEYYLGTNNKGKVNAFAREYEMTASQMIKEFGLESVSDTVKAAYSNGKVDQLFKVRHVIEENKNYDENKEDYFNMPFKSCYWESASHDGKYLGQRGYKRFPVIAPRWKTITTEMVYGYGQGWHAIGDIKELQAVHSDMLIAQEKLHTPPLLKDASIQGHFNNIPGGVTSVSGSAPNGGVWPAYQVNPNLESFIMSIDRLHKSIDRFFFADLFMMITSMDNMGSNPQRTAFEIAERKAEKMMMLGPVLHRLNEEMHDRLIEEVFNILLDNGLLPPVPKELTGGEIKIQHVSILAQSQKALGVAQIEKVLMFVANASTLYPEARHYLNIGEAIREVAELEGAPTKIIPDQDDVDEKIAQEAQQNAMMQAVQAGNSVADSTNKLAKAQMSEPSALSGLMGQ